MVPYKPIDPHGWKSILIKMHKVAAGMLLHTAKKGLGRLGVKSISLTLVLFLFVSVKALNLNETLKVLKNPTQSKESSI